MFIYFGYAPPPNTGSVCVWNRILWNARKRTFRQLNPEASGRHKCLLFQKRPQSGSRLAPARTLCSGPEPGCWPACLRVLHRAVWAPTVWKRTELRIPLSGRNRRRPGPVPHGPLVRLFPWGPWILGARAVKTFITVEGGCRSRVFPSRGG